VSSEAQKIAIEYQPDIQVVLQGEHVLPLTHGKSRGDEICFYMCANETCSLPYESFDEVQHAIYKLRNTE
jgi:uncharacterized protein YyaL (SSP411 family)